MLALVAGLTGAVIGWLLKTISDLMAERRASRRADATWRRQLYVDAVARLAHSGRELMSADSRISRATYSLSNAEQGGNPAIIATCQDAHREATARQLPWTTSTIQALEAVRLYAPDNIVKSADATWSAIYNGGSFPDVRNIPVFERAVLDALASLRAETRTTAGLN